MEVQVAVIQQDISKLTAMVQTLMEKLTSDEFIH
jgi:hypothetical protein